MAKKLTTPSLFNINDLPTAKASKPVQKNEISLVEELHDDFLIYANQVNTNRAFPDVRDGLKISQRAVLWEMYNKGYSSNKPHVKSAKVDGGVIANWHPHGSEYLTLVRMSQSWVNNICEIDFHGGNGSLLGGPEAAHARYTQCRLSEASEDGLFENIKKNTVEFILNFSEDETWPKVLPAIFPRLFVNGSQGIGYTIAQEWEPGNLNELYEKVKIMLKTGKIDYDNIYPDYPTGGIIINKEAISEIYRTGRGQVILRGRAEIVGNFIQITELPYQVYAEPLIQKIKELVNNNQISDIEDICNKSDDNGLLIEIECSQNPTQVLNLLYKLTDLQTTYNANQMALDANGKPVMFNLKDYLQAYIAHNIECIVREYTWELEKAQTRKEIVDGLIRATSMIDELIAVIRKSPSSADAKTEIEAKFGFLDRQAKAIIDLRLGKLSGLELSELQKEQVELAIIISECQKLLASSQEQNKEFLSRLKSFVKQFAYPRHTEVINVDLEAQRQEAKPQRAKKEDTSWIVILTKAGTLKRVNPANYRPVKKPVGDTDIELCNITALASQRIVLISNNGTMYKLPVNKIPVCNTGAAGMPTKDLFKQPIIALYRGEEWQAYKYLFMLTKRGLAKKIDAKTVLTLSKLSGAPIMRVDENDQIILCKLVNEDSFEVTYAGKVKVIDTKKFLPKGRTAGGVVAIKTKPGSFIEV